MHRKNNPVYTTHTVCAFTVTCEQATVCCKIIQGEGVGREAVGVGVGDVVNVSRNELVISQ